jgi:hypothetical protein
VEEELAVRYLSKAWCAAPGLDTHNKDNESINTREGVIVLDLYS